MAKRLGYVIYQGPSELDGKPIVVIATGFGEGSTNVKTGAMIQTWIMRADISPLEATHSGEDSSICGLCPHRGVTVLQEDGTTRNRLRSCYVLTFQAPLSIWRAYKRGSYEDATGWEPADIAALFKERVVRLGAYGDPAAVPERVWAYATLEAAKWAGYTHQWRSLPATSLLRTLVMASADSEMDALHAQTVGWRTFRVGESRLENEVTCPASEEGGKKTTCDKCALCQGAYKEAKNIVIRPHGNRIRTLRKRLPAAVV